MDLPPAEQLLASTIQYLIQGSDKETALVTLCCDAEYGQMHRTPKDACEHFTVCLVGPRVTHDAYRRREDCCQLPRRSYSEGLATREDHPVAITRCCAPTTLSRVRIRRPANGLGGAAGVHAQWPESRGAVPPPTKRQTPSSRRLAVSGPPPVARCTEHRARFLRVSGSCSAARRQTRKGDSASPPAAERQRSPRPTEDDDDSDGCYTVAPIADGALGVFEAVTLCSNPSWIRLRPR